ncbi:MAG: 23S rRNA (pseudouridine(1915)-N(3))-methyltransferase RlmH, partial [Pseudomonadota bacterium]
SRLIPPEKGNNPAKEAEQLKATLRGKAVLLDERGAMSSSPEIAALIAKCRDEGTKELSFCIGGAHGFTDELRREVKAEGGALLAFGRAVWPHALCRVMIAEQIYRALAILAGHPYHRL